MSHALLRATRAPLAILLLAAFAIPAALASSAPDGRMRQTFRMSLGGDSGYYTDWEMKDVVGFHSVQAKVDIGDTDGKPTDKWAALARIALVGAGEGEARKLFSVMIVVDRKDKSRSVSTECGAERTGFDIEVPKGAFEVEIAQVSETELRVTVGDSYADFECEIDVVGVRALGSGLDVGFDPLVVTSGIPGAAR